MSWDDRTPEKRRWQPLGGPQRRPTISDYTDLTKVCHKWRISTWRQPLQPWPSVESRTHMALFHCMVRHGTVRFTFGGFSTGYCTWYFFSTTSVEVPCKPYRYQNVTCKLCWSLIGRRKSSLLRHWTCDTRPSSTVLPLDLNQHSQRRIGRNFCLNKRTFLHQPQNSSVVVCWGSSDVPLVDSRGADPARAWWCETEGKSLMYNVTFELAIFTEYVFCLYFYLCICVLLQLKTIWSNKCTSRLY